MQFLIIIAVGMVLVTDRMQSPLVLAPELSGAVAVITSMFALVMIWIRTVRKKILTQLESGMLPVDMVQRTYVRAQHGLRLLALAGHGLLVFGTEWPKLVRLVLGPNTVGLDELVILAPFVLWILAGYFFLYPADRAIRESMIGPMLEFSHPVHPIWTRGQYLLFQIQFQVLLIGLPLMLIVAAKDLIDIPRDTIVAFSRPILARFGLRMFGELVPEVILLACSGVVFLFSPFLVKWVWRSRTLPDGELRRNLLRMARDANLKCRDILLWPTYGIIVNAAVVGFFGRLRYIMLSDGLIESLTDGQIEAVFGHEIGHVKLHHLPFFLLFAVGSMGLVCLAGVQMQVSLHISEQAVEGFMMASVMVIWFLAFGFISRRFEAQADLFGVQLLSIQFDQGGCVFPECPRHGVKLDSLLGVDPLCLSGAELFSSALDRTAALNAIPRTARSWRHGSIAQRCRFVVDSARRLPSLLAFKLQVGWIKLILLAALVVCVIWGLGLLAVLRK